MRDICVSLCWFEEGCALSEKVMSLTSPCNNYSFATFESVSNDSGRFAHNSGL